MVPIYTHIIFMVILAKKLPFDSCNLQKKHYIISMQLLDCINKSVRCLIGLTLYNLLNKGGQDNDKQIPINF